MNLNRRGFLRVAGGLAAALSVDRSSLGRILASRVATVSMPVRLRMTALTSTVFVTQELLDDAAFDLKAMLAREFGENFRMKVI